MKPAALLPALLAAAMAAAAMAATPARAFDEARSAAGAGTIQFAFSPDGDAARLVIRAIDTARAEVLVQAFSFTHAEIAAALVRAHRRGLVVQVIADPGQIELIEHNVVGTLAAAGVRVFTDAAHSAAHNKVVVLDADEANPGVITGSFNFTFAAQYRNAENVLLIRDNRELVRAYRENWQLHRAHSAPLDDNRH